MWSATSGKYAEQDGRMQRGRFSSPSSGPQIWLYSGLLIVSSTGLITSAFQQDWASVAINRLLVPLFAAMTVKERVKRKTAQSIDE